MNKFPINGQHSADIPLVWKLNGQKAVIYKQKQTKWCIGKVGCVVALSDQSLALVGSFLKNNNNKNPHKHFHILLLNAS